VTAEKKYLVFTSAGDRHSIDQWLGPDRKYEVMVVYYGEDEFSLGHAVEYSVRRAGSKFQNLKFVHQNDSDFLGQFDAVFVLDDDIEIGTAAINELFEMRSRYDLAVLQPSFDRTGRISHQILASRPRTGCVGRVVNFVEVCCPLFRTDMLVRFLEHYDGSLTGWGIDWWYMEYLSRFQGFRAAVIDTIRCRNPHTTEKGTGPREIDALQPRKSRIGDWQKKKAELNLTLSETGARVLGYLHDDASVGAPDVPRISIVIEWENAILADDSIQPALLERLARQADLLKEPIEILTVLDPAVVDRAALAAVFSRYFSQHRFASTGFLGVPGKHYYELKNHGARQARGDIVIFADSDIIPNRRWLTSHVHFLDDNPGVAMTAGYTFIKPEGIVGKAFAAGWFFPLRPRGQRVNEPASFLWANNCAYRRSALLAHPFPDGHGGQTRGACGRQLMEFKESGLRTANISAAQVIHPPPNGVGHFVSRAMAEGRDHCLDRAAAVPGSRASILHILEGTAGFAIKRLRQTYKRLSLKKRRSRVHVRPLEAVAVLSLMACYYALYCCGALLSALAPNWASRQWRI
jgi:hypothetical protein